MSACASSRTSATGPCTAACARSSPSTIEWSPPSTSGVTPARTSGSSAGGDLAGGALGVARRDRRGRRDRRPRARANTSTSSGGWYGRRPIEAERIASGPKRAPGRLLVAVSNGTPTAATSTPSRSSRADSARRSARRCSGAPAMRRAGRSAGSSLRARRPQRSHRGPRTSPGAPPAPSRRCTTFATSASVSTPLPLPRAFSLISSA